MKTFIFGFICAFLVIGGIWFFSSKKEKKEEIQEQSAMIQEQIQQVGKLIVTEGYFSQVFSYKNSQNLFLNLLSSNKKALVVANAKATVEYDLRKLELEMDIENKTVIIKNIPEPVINIYPDIEYYDITQDYFNKFDAADYNKIKSRVTDQFRRKVEQSTLKANARERLMAELSNILLLTKSLGWTLLYEEMVISDEDLLQQLRF